MVMDSSPILLLLVLCLISLALVSDQWLCFVTLEESFYLEARRECGGEPVQGWATGSEGTEEVVSCSQGQHSAI